MFNMNDQPINEQHYSFPQAYKMFLSFNFLQKAFLAYHILDELLYRPKFANENIYGKPI